ncbi:OpgD/OpgG family glucan biosynthesis protein [Bowmanella dokdonensis]|uniref:Glucans biosynthesis protein G n=1 Tax=Bowmanella dokdonensis TaxID=751969 RepID=A0A939DM07_9ALTE|nr:glucan biosynthesis protein G [Bowmanella dokdonensis]MBN7825228.1 glucan biosynthesis protein [Bowmanella dokdonensis]
MRNRNVVGPKGRWSSLSQGWYWLVLLWLSAVSQAQEALPANQGKTDAQLLFDLMTKRAQELSSKPHEVPDTPLPANWLNMDYEQYRSIRFKSEQALWDDQALFEVQFFHPGFLYRSPVEIEAVNHDGVNRRIAFDPSMFSYDNRAAPLEQQVEGAGFAGFRVHFPLNTAAYKDEVAVFQGASYFRLVGPGQLYGLSARGLSIDTAMPEGEEFPHFRQFWLMKPQPEDAHLVFFALLDSPSVTGAYRFELQPGMDTKMDITARLFARKDVSKLGIAPMTSMFLYGENKVRFVDDFRPEIHDSDGVLMHTSRDEWIWRPLRNPRQLQVTSLSDDSPQGFGLVQRDRDFAHYQDTEAHYHRRPSLWVTPQGQWGKGRLEVVEIPTNNETNDNIVTYWVPEQPLKAGEQREYSYSLQTFDSTLHQEPLAQVTQTRIGWAALPGQHNPPPRELRQFIVDFAGPGLANLSPSQAVEARLQLSSGEYKELKVNHLPNGQWRASFKLLPREQQTVDMRLQLHLREQNLTEVWNYVWNPSDIK